MADSQLSVLSTEELADRAQRVAAGDPSRESDERWALVRELHNRIDERVFRVAAAWCISPARLLRCLGADVLGQLGYKDSFPYSNESTPILIRLLEDSEPEVVSCSLVALGHLGKGDPVAICPLASHQSPHVRQSVAFCLGVRDDELSRQTLILLSADEDTDVRSWATFGLGALSEVDGPSIRDALFNRLLDIDQEVRGEAMVGLARRGDERAIPSISQELEQAEVSSLAIEAASEFGLDIFLPALTALLEKNPGDVEILNAIARCSPR